MKRSLLALAAWALSWLLLPGEALAAECEYKPGAGLTRIYKGADSQLIELVANCPAGATAPTFTPGATIWLTHGAAVLSATVAAPPPNLQLHVHVAAGVSLTAGSHTWQLLNPSGPTANFVIDVTDSPLVTGLDAGGQPALAISYDQNQRLDRLHAAHSVAGQAVVTPHRDGNARRDGDKSVFVQNTVTFAGAAGSELNLIARQLTSQAVAQRTATCGRQDPDPTCNAECRAKRVECHANLVRAKPWQVTPSPPGGSVWLSYDGSDDSDWWNELAELDELNRLTFAAFAETASALEVTVQLVDVSKPLPGAAFLGPMQSCFDHYDESREKIDASGERCRVLLTARVKVAAGARLESLPLPIADLLYIQCGAETMSNVDPILSCIDQDFEDNTICSGQMRAIDEAQLASGQCRLNYDPGRAAALSGYDKEKQLKAVLEIYEQQDIEVTVSRGSSTSDAVLWSLDPTQPQNVILPLPAAAATQTGVYQVRAVLSGPAPRAVTYRPSNGAAAVSAKGARALGDFEFIASLRPRGAYGWSIPLRTYVTLPVDFFGYRFPAAPRYLEASSDPTGVQAVSLRAGLLLAIEPYDYDTGANPLPIPLRTLHGFHLYDLSAGSFAPALVNGISMRFPILNLEPGNVTNQLGTDLSVNAYWEIDLSGVEPYGSSHHFLLTVGASVLSLFGSK